ncbi:MAG: hypothetical protein NZ608_07600 [candidate division WOR-3 bacterium]|nr:hypothetical protein [candidate division WOR-3 bacterium]
MDSIAIEISTSCYGKNFPLVIFSRTNYLAFWQEEIILGIFMEQELIKQVSF